MTLPVPSHDSLAIPISHNDDVSDRRRAWRLTLVLFATLLLHNFPEGLAVAASAVHSPRLGQTTAVAIALHNIPEGLVISVPCLAARPDAKWLAIGLATLSGLAEPLGAWVALTLWQQPQQQELVAAATTTTSLPHVLALVGGIMSAVALRELFPEAWWYAQKDDHNYTPLVSGVVLGAVLMVATETILAH